MTFSGRSMVSLVMLAIFGAMAVIALDFPVTARMMPLLISLPACVLALAQLIHDLRAGADAKSLGMEATVERRRELHMFLWLAGFFAAILGFGFLIGGPVLVFAFLRLGQRESWPISVIGGIAAWAILYVVFTLGLELFLFEGFLPPLLFE